MLPMRTSATLVGAKVLSVNWTVPGPVYAVADCGSVGYCRNAQPVHWTCSVREPTRGSFALKDPPNGQGNVIPPLLAVSAAGVVASARNPRVRPARSRDGWASPVSITGSVED